jgi:cytochrome c
MRYARPTATLFFCLLGSSGFAADDDVALGARAFRACAACHSVEANRNMTGPSLADIWNRKAGSVSSFLRYSETMKSSEVIWNEKTLDGYLENPAQFMPGNHMTFPGVPDEKTRKSIIAFLKQAGDKPTEILANQQTGQAKMNGMPGMQRPVPNLKTAEASSRISNYLLSQHLQGDDGRWKNSRLLGA